MLAYFLAFSGCNACSFRNYWVKTEIEAEQDTLMHCFRCGLCCKETEMLLLEEDIERLERKGYPRNFFALLDKEGYAKLRNVQGYCVFHDAKNHRCRVYADRPSGCRLYPVIFVESIGIRVDNICRSKVTFNDTDVKRKGIKVLKLLERIDKEAKNRRLAK